MKQKWLFATYQLEGCDGENAMYSQNLSIFPLALRFIILRSLMSLSVVMRQILTNEMKMAVTIVTSETRQLREVTSHGNSLVGCLHIDAGHQGTLRLRGWSRYKIEGSRVP